MDNDVTYSPHLISLVDILGFTDLIRGKVNKYPPNKVYEMLSTIEEVNRTMGSEFQDNQHLKSITFSDLAVRAFDYTELEPFDDTLNIELRRWCVAQAYLVIRGILMRGAVVFGDLFFKDNMIYGPAFIEAHDLERMIARYPRIILSGSVLRHIEDQSKVDIKRGDDGVFFLDYLEVAYRLGQPGLEKPGFGNDYLKRHQQIITNKLNDLNGPFNERYVKLLWLAHYHNKTIRGLMKREDINYDEADSLIVRPSKEIEGLYGIVPNEDLSAGLLNQAEQLGESKL